MNPAMTQVRLSDGEYGWFPLSHTEEARAMSMAKNVCEKWKRVEQFKIRLGIDSCLPIAYCFQI